MRLLVLPAVALAAAGAARAQQPEVVGSPLQPAESALAPAPHRAARPMHWHRPRAAALPAPSESVKAIAGRYAVLRGTRDTGCMVTFFAEARSRGFERAVLAPACRDTGIVIFDPVGWKPGPDGLVLEARDGHTITLAGTGPGLWSRQASTPPLVLRRI